MTTTTVLPTISAEELHEKLDAGEAIELIDVRTPAEFREIHVSFAHNEPLDRIDPEVIRQRCHGTCEQPLYVICRSGKRAEQACNQLAAAGLNVVSVEGGTLAWEQAGLPVVRGKKALSLERQVRIAAGLLAVIGSVLGYFVHPLFIGLAAFVGAGLIYAGVTDRCGMALMLGRMPWNQVNDSSSRSTESCCSN